MALRVNNASIEALLEKAVCYELANDAERSDEMLKRAIACDDTQGETELIGIYEKKLAQMKLPNKNNEEKEETEAEA